MIYPVHHLLGEGTDVFNDPYLLMNSQDSVTIDSLVLRADSIEQHQDSVYLYGGDLYAHVMGPDANVVTSFTLRDISDSTRVLETQLGSATTSGAVHLHQIYLDFRKKPTSGEMFEIVVTSQVQPTVSRGNTSGGQYYRFFAGNVKTSMIKYTLK